MVDAGEWDDGGEEGGWDDYEDGGENSYMAPAVVDYTPINSKGFKCVNGTEVSKQVVVKMEELNDMYALDTDHLIIIARHYKWNTDHMADWFNENVSSKLVHCLGIEFDTTLPVRRPEMNATLPENHGGYCLICYEELSGRNSFALSCRHTFCVTCWTNYLVEKIQSGHLGIDANCMQVGCNMKVGHTVFEKYLAPSPETKTTYWRWLCKSFTDENKNIKWCPSPYCEFCCERQDLGRMLYEVECNCGTVFCFQCSQISHKPCDCDSATKWLQKASAESENVTWIQANTKPCPKCRKSIEKNQGCNHMTCLQCRHDFCWTCMGEWKDHGSATGGYYKCNLYESRTKDSNFMSEEKKRTDASNELQRYMWFYERYANHEKSSGLAVKLMPVLKNKMQLLHEHKSYPPKELEFLQKSCEVVIQCRDVLKWTYAYGYYRMKTMGDRQKNLFEQWQSDLEKFCDHLHGLVEKDLDQFMDPNLIDRTPFYHHRSQLTQYSEATRTFFTNLIEGIKEEEDKM